MGEKILITKINFAGCSFSLSIKLFKKEILGCGHMTDSGF